MLEKISAVYCIRNTVTNERYIGSSKDVQARWYNHTSPSSHMRHPNIRLYQDMDKYGIDKFVLTLVALVEPEHLRQVEQAAINMFNPEYNSVMAFGRDTEKVKANEYRKNHSEKGKERKRRHDEKRKRNGYWKDYYHTEAGKESARKASAKYQSHKCIYNGEELTLTALSKRFRKAGYENPTLEARKYLVKEVK